MTRRVKFVRTAAAEFEVSFTGPDGLNELRAVQTEREMRVTLGDAQEWPAIVRRGRGVDLEMSIGGDLFRLQGRVKWKRLKVAVFEGRMSRV